MLSRPVTLTDRDAAPPIWLDTSAVAEFILGPSAKVGPFNAQLSPGRPSIESWATDAGGNGFMLADSQEVKMLLQEKSRAFISLDLELATSTALSLSLYLGARTSFDL